MSLFIMAAGNSTRWKRYAPDHLKMGKLEVDIHGKPLIHWTIDQLKSSRIKYKLITQAEVGATKSVCESILASRAQWKGITTCLLGDVVWSDAALDLVLNFNISDWQLFGNKVEIFALRFKSKVHRWMVNALTSTINESEGKLRDLRHILNFGRLLRRDTSSSKVDEEISRRLDSNFTFIRDWTRDIDHYAAYTRFMQIESAKEELLCRSKF